MLREYISGKIRENEELVMDLEGDIKKLKDRKKELEKLIQVIKDENNDGTEIFSPRNHRDQNMEKLNQYQGDIKKIEQEMEEKIGRLSEAEKKRSEYKSMLAEVDKSHSEEKTEYSKIDRQIKSQTEQPGSQVEVGEEKVQPEETKTFEQIRQENDNLEREEEQSKEEQNKAATEEESEHESDQQEQMKQNDGGNSSAQDSAIRQEIDDSIFEQVRAGIERELGKVSLDGIEIKSAELIVLESERKKEKEFLEKVKKSVEFCFEYSGSKNKCKNELRKLKRMIEEYIFSLGI